jgi:hypothetical protein
MQNSMEVKLKLCQYTETTIFAIFHRRREGMLVVNHEGLPNVGLKVVQLVETVENENLQGSKTLQLGLGSVLLMRQHC